MQRCISRRPTAQLTLVGTRVGSKVAKAVLMSLASGKLTPEILNEALLSSSTVRGHVQREAMKLLVVRVSLRTPQQLQWLLHLIGDCVGGLSLTGAVSSLTKRSLLYQIANFGLRGSAASAITTAAVQVGLTTCTLITSNAAFWRKGDHGMSMRQYRYELATSMFTGMGTVVGGAAGAAVGSLVMPGIGTAFGSVLCSVGAGYVPGYLRDKKGPDDKRRQQATALRAYTPFRMEETEEGAVLMYAECLTETPPIAPPAAAAGVPTPCSVLSTAHDSAGLSSTSSVDVISTGSEAREGAGPEEVEEEETVWLDFVRARTITPALLGSAVLEAAVKEQKGDAGGSPVSPIPAGVTSRAPVDPAAVDVPHVRSFLRFTPVVGGLSQNEEAPASASPPSASAHSSSTDAPLMLTATSSNSSFADLDQEEGAAAPAAPSASAGSLAERFEGQAKYITVSNEDELEAEVARFGGENDMLFLFA